MSFDSISQPGRGAPDFNENSVETCNNNKKRSRKHGARIMFCEIIARNVKQVP